MVVASYVRDYSEQFEDNPEIRDSLQELYKKQCNRFKIKVSWKQKYTEKRRSARMKGNNLVQEKRMGVDERDGWDYQLEVMMT